MLASHFSSLFLLGLVAVAFYIEDLRLSRMVMVIFPVTTIGIYSVNYIYANDVCPPSMFSINHFLVRLMPMVFGLIPSIFIRFEDLGYKEVAMRLFGMIFIGFLAFLWLAVFMVETDGMTKRDVFYYFRGMGRSLDRDDGEEIIAELH